MSKLKCPKCKRTHIQLLSNDIDMKTTTKTSLNLNPLKPFTVFNHKTEKKEKTSATKVGLALMTGGTSLLMTGTKKKAHNEYFCTDCANRWVGK